MNSRERILRFLSRQPVDRPCVMPITMMFAAEQIGVPYGRYTLEPELLAEAQIRTAERFDFDHVSTITETREAPDCGAAVRYFDNQPYALDELGSLLAGKNVLGGLRFPDPLGGGRMHERVRAIALLKQRVGGEKWLEGWVEGPCGAASDLRGINRLMTDFYDDPGFVRDLFEFCLELAVRFGRAQAEAGVDGIGIGDPAASLVGPELYSEFIWPYEKRLVDQLHALGVRVRLHICGNTRRILEGMGRLGCDIVDVDSMVPISEARSRMGAGQALLGGVDPVRIIHSGPTERVRLALEDCHAQAGERYILGGGCEIPPGTPTSHVRALAECARLIGHV